MILAVPSARSLGVKIAASRQLQRPLDARRNGASEGWGNSVCDLAVLVEIPNRPGSSSDRPSEHVTIWKPLDACRFTWRQIAILDRMVRHFSTT